MLQDAFVGWATAGGGGGLLSSRKLTVEKSLIGPNGQPAAINVLKMNFCPGLVVLLTVCWFSLYKVRGIPIVGAQCPAHSAQPPPRVRTEANLTLNPPTSVSIWNGCVCEVEVSLVGIYRGGTTTFRSGQW